MPTLFHRPGAQRALVALLASFAFAQGAAAQGAQSSAVDNSDLDAQLFYQLLIGEMELRSGEAGTAYEVVLDAARRNKDEQLFRRATDIALQARAGEQALAAAKAWRTALPNSLDAHRFLVQLLVALNRVPETAEPLRSLLSLTPAAERPALISSLPRFFNRSTDRPRAASLIEQVLQPYADLSETRVPARVAMGRAWLAALDTTKALDLALGAHALDPSAETPALLALELLPGRPAAETIVMSHLKAKPDSNGVRVSYVRTLSASQR